MAERYCVGCGIEIERPFWLCQTCEDDFGVSGKDYRYWPAWLKHLKNSAKREEYEESRGHVSLALDDDDADGVLVDNDGNVYSSGPRDLTDADLMRYAPYADEAANREYRRACGIPERVT